MCHTLETQAPNRTNWWGWVVSGDCGQLPNNCLCGTTGSHIVIVSHMGGMNGKDGEGGVGCGEVNVNSG